MIQDAGTEMTDEQKGQVQAKPKKRFTRKIRLADRLHPDLYKLAEMFHAIFEQDDRGGKWFTKLPSNRSDCLHKIGTWIAENRTRVARADFHTHQSNDLKALLTDESYKDKDVLYYLSQKDLITKFFEEWGETQKDLFKPQTDDILRLLGIMLTCEEVREFIPDILGKRRSMRGRHNIDSAVSRANAAWAILVPKFIDEEVVVTFPAKWKHDDFIQRINERAEVEDFYATHGTFNPNNIERMKLPWTKKLLEEVLKVGRGHYEEMMVTYTEGTGGGPGAPENFADWKERDESYILKYTPQQAAMLYLTIVFMWDKTHDFPLKPAVGKMNEGREDEQYDGDGGGGDDDFTTPVPPAGGGKQGTTGGKGDAQIASAIENMNTQRQKLMDTLMGNVDGGNATNETRTDKQHKLVIQMKETREEIKEVKNELDELNAKRKLYEEKYANNPNKKKRKLKKISNESKLYQSMHATLKTTLLQYGKELKHLNESDESKTLDYDIDGSGSESNSSDSSDSSSGSGD